MLESLCRDRQPAIATALSLDAAGIWRSDWQPLLSMLTDSRRGVAHRAECFHASMAQIVVDQASRLRDDNDIDQVGLTGGVFQNRFLVDACIEGLSSAGFKVHVADELPSNDASLCFGQSVELAARDRRINAHG